MRRIFVVCLAALGAVLAFAVAATRSESQAPADRSAGCCMSGAMGSGQGRMGGMHMGMMRPFQPLPAAMEAPVKPITPAKVALGRLRYYETRPTANAKVSCNSCH